MDRLIETRHVAATEYRHITVPGGQQDGDNWLFLPQAAGAIVCRDQLNNPGQLWFICSVFKVSRIQAQA